MSGSAIEIYLKTIASGDGAKRVASDLHAVNAAADKAAAAQARVSGSSRNMGNALLQGSRAIQDMQYGLAGAVNNLEGIATALGLGAGVAGVVTVLAVAVQTLGPHVVEWFKSLDTEGKKLKELEDKLRSAATAILGEWTPATQAADDASKQFTSRIDAEKAALDALEGSLKSSLGILKERNKLTADIGKNEDETKIAEIKAKGLPKEEEERQIARVKIDRLNANKKAAEGEITGEREVVDQNLANAEAAAQQAEQRRQKLEAEKRLSIRSATIDLEIAGSAEKKDENGKVITPAKKGAAERVKEAEDQARAAYLASSDPLNDENVKLTEQRAAQERERLARLEAEQKRNIELNGGSSQFRYIADIEKDLGTATPAAASAAAKAEAARKAQAEFNATADLRRQKIESDYRKESTAITAPIEDRAPAPRERVEPDPFEIAQRNPRPRRDLAAEEAAGAGSFKGRNLAAEEKSGTAEAMKQLLETSKQSDAALMAAIKQLTAEKKKLGDQLKNSRT